MNDLNEWRLQSKAQDICKAQFGIRGFELQLQQPFKRHPNAMKIQAKQETIDFDYCIIAAGCNFGPFHKPENSVKHRVELPVAAVHFPKL